MRTGKIAVSAILGTRMNSIGSRTGLLKDGNQHLTLEVCPLTLRYTSEEINKAPGFAFLPEAWPDKQPLT